MRFRINTIAKRLFLSFGILVFNIIVIASLALFFLWHTRTISKIGQQADNQRILITQLIRTDLDFLRFETVNQNFYKTGKSTLLEKRDSLFKVIRSANDVLFQRMIANDFQLDSQFREVDKLLEQYSETFQVLTRKINERGFKDYGLEGMMRSYAHKLENMESPIVLTEVLMLRRHEKDFLLRKEERYIREYNRLADTLIAKARTTRHEASLVVLENYRDLFNRLTRLDYEIGITPTEGLLGKLNHETALISGVLRELTRLSAERIENDVNKSTVLLSVISLVTIVASTLLTYYTATRMAHPIKKLSLSMGKFMVNEGLNEKDFENVEETNEINSLSQAFIKLSRKLKNQFGEIQQQNRELKKLNEELDRFIYSAAHDLKSPLASMDGLIRLAEREINSPGHAHYFQMMSSSVHKLDGFIRDITDYARNKRQHLKIEKVDLERLILDILDSVRFLPHASLMRPHVSVTGLEFYTDRARLEIVLKNLISNSYRYMDFSKPDPYIKIEGVVGEQELRINVIDNGIGIGKSHLPRIFDMFYRAVEHSQGTGIGLFLVKESVKMLRGRISVKSSLGEWTVFHLVLPNLKDGNLNAPESEVYMLEEPRELQA